MKRIGIYLTYDKQGVIDRYIGYMLNALKDCTEYMIVVCNEEKVVKGQEILERYADEVFYRENIGFDAGGFRDALCNYVGWDKVLQYDELVLVNDSMFGPFRPMKEIFAEMEGRAVDFWGLAMHGEGANHFVGYIKEHIQSYFFVVGSRMLQSRGFREYWENMPYFSSFKETIQRYEVGFTQYFSDLGYTYDALADTKANDSEHYLNNYSQYAMIPYELMTKRNFPFFKKQPLTGKTLYCQTQQNFRQAINYIDRETDYDIDLIWDNVIRTLDMSDLQHSLHLQYIMFGRGGQAVPGSLAVAVFLAYRESAEYVLEYLRRLPETVFVYLFAEDAAYLEPYQRQGYQCRVSKPNREAEILCGFDTYDYVCVIHDADVTSDTNYSCVGKSHFYNIWENLLGSDSQVMEVAACFNAEPRLGFLAPPQPNFWKFFGEYGREWDGKFETVRSITEELGLNCQISQWKAPFRITRDFWVRGRILRGLKQLKRAYGPYLPYLWIYLAQDAGYYSGIVESAEYASMNEINQQFYLNKLALQVRQQCGDFADFTEMKESIRTRVLEAFCGKYKRILAYGAGEEARIRRKQLPRIESYIVSDGQKKPGEIDGIQVKYLSEVNLNDDCGIVLCLNRLNQLQVIPLLEARGFFHYFCI